MRRKEVRVVSAIREKNKVSEEDYSFDMRSLGHVSACFTLVRRERRRKVYRPRHNAASIIIMPRREEQVGRALR